MNKNAVVVQEVDIFGKLPAYPSPKPSLAITSYLGQNVGLLGEG